MARDEKDMVTIERPKGFARSFEDALAQLKRTTGSAVRVGAVATMLALGPGAGLVACAVDGGGPGESAPVIDGAADGWYTERGVRNTDVVRYEGSSWHEYYDCSNRGGCMGVAVFLKVLVQPFDGANLDSKRVGVEYVTPYGGTRTAVGSYYTTLESGMEEWHVRVDLRSWETSLLRFDTWYEDGRGNLYYDDNAGEGHVEAFRGSSSVIYSYMPYGEDGSPVTVGPDGVHGRIMLMLADIDYDKDVAMVWTTDNWATTNVFGMGGGEANALRWVADTWSDHESWAIDLDIPGPVEAFEYAFVYRHGVVNGAQPYEFWDNNGGNNYVVRAAVE